jgi:hypothetical protein
MKGVISVVFRSLDVPAEDRIIKTDDAVEKVGCDFKSLADSLLRGVILPLKTVPFCAVKRVQFSRTYDGPRGPLRLRFFA